MESVSIWQGVLVPDRGPDERTGRRACEGGSMAALVEEREVVFERVVAEAGAPAP